jgi:hypothetical protein
MWRQLTIPYPFAINLGAALKSILRFLGLVLWDKNEMHHRPGEGYLDVPLQKNAVDYVPCIGVGRAYATDSHNTTPGS